MLTIQPNITNQTIRKQPAFKAEQNRDDSFYESKTNYYEGQKKDFEDLSNDIKTPKALKKIAKTFAVISTMLLEGWAVAWGATKGAKFVKSSVASGLDTEFVKGSKEVLKPIYKGFVQAGNKIAEFAKAASARIKGTKIYTNLSEKLAKVVEKMENNKFGKVVLTVLRTIGKGAKKVADFIAKPFKTAANKIKETSFDTAYDNATKTVSTTLGVGAGAASGYNEIVHPEQAKADKELEEEV